LEGITEWWLLSQRIHEEAKKVKEALTSLVEQGWLVKIKGSDSQIRYRFSPERKAH
jgi:DNA-binding transcriptional regulator PaaX